MKTITLPTILFLLFCITLPALADSKIKPGLRKPRKELFSHPNHQKHFEKMGVTCVDCHAFTIKSSVKGPSATQIDQKFLKPTTGICHQCHMGKVNVPHRNQCMLCHQDLSTLKPESHFNAWRTRHGKMSELDQDSCRACHAPRDCTGCHAKQNTLAPQVHRPNFRLSHSISARLDAQSCTTCHRTSNFCLDCHTGRKN